MIFSSQRQAVKAATNFEIRLRHFRPLHFEIEPLTSAIEFPTTPFMLVLSHFQFIQFRNAYYFIHRPSRINKIQDFQRKKIFSLDYKIRTQKKTIIPK